MNRGAAAGSGATWIGPTSARSSSSREGQSGGSRTKSPSAFLSKIGRKLLTTGLLRLYKPDISISNRVAVILQVNRPRIGPRFDGGRTRAAVGGQLHVFVNHHAVMLHGNPGGRNDLVAIVPGGCVINVIGLPGQRRVAHVEVGVFQL